MEKRSLNAVDSSFAYFAGFIFSQLAVLFFTILALIVGNLFGINADSLQAFLNTALGYLLCTIVFDFAFIGVFIFYKKKTNVQVIKKVNYKKLILYIFLAALAFVMVSPLINCLDSLFNLWGIKINTLSYSITDKINGVPVNFLLSIITLVILPAIAEELLFRGIIYSGLKSHGRAISVLMTSLMFSIFHMSISQTVYPLIMGMLFTVIMSYEENILYTISMHIVNNLLSLIFAYFNISLSYNHWTFILLAIVLACVFVAVLLVFILRKNNQTKTPLTKNEHLALWIILGIMILINIVTNLANNFIL